MAHLESHVAPFSALLLASSHSKITYHIALHIAEYTLIEMPMLLPPLLLISPLLLLHLSY